MTTDIDIRIGGTTIRAPIETTDARALERLVRREGPHLAGILRLLLRESAPHIVSFNRGSRPFAIVATRPRTECIGLSTGETTDINDTITTAEASSLTS